MTKDKEKDLVKRFFRGFNAGFKPLTNRYRQSVKFLIQNKWIAILALVIIVLDYFLDGEKDAHRFYSYRRPGFYCLFGINLPPGASLDRTQKVMDEIDSLLSQVEAIEKRGAVTGLNFIANASSSNYGVGFIHMKPPGKSGPCRVK